MWLDLLFIFIFLLGIYYIIHYRLNLKKAAERSKDALYPKEEKEFSSILIPAEWKEMIPLTKETKSYRYVHWGTIGALLLLTVLLILVLTSDVLGSSLFSFAYLFFAMINAIQHRGNLFILPTGVVLHGRYYSDQQIRSYKIEQIIRWHELYGLDDRVNHAYKLTIQPNRTLFNTNYVVVEDREHLDKIVSLLKARGIPGEEVQESEVVGK